MSMRRVVICISVGLLVLGMALIWCEPAKG